MKKLIIACVAVGCLMLTGCSKKNPQPSPTPSATPSAEPTMTPSASPETAEGLKGILEAIQRAGARLEAVDALALAMDAGSVKAVNVVLIGVMARQTDIPKEVWQEAVRTVVPERFVELNLKAFEAGYTAE